MNLVANSLVLYKVHPARVLTVGEKIEIELVSGQIKRVRLKDVELLHPGPLHDLGDLLPQDGEVEEAWSLLEGSTTNLAELAELIYATFTPCTAWATWQLVANGLFFSGNMETIQARSRIAVEQDRKERQERETARREWAEFIGRVRNKKIVAADWQRLQEVEQVALGRTESSRILETLGYQVSKENAHSLLVEWGCWQPEHNPYPTRCGVNLEPPQLDVPTLPQESRRDLTHLAAFAIDNEGNQDPDDAISWDGERLWVHVADVAALIVPDDLLDREARARGANLYIPEQVIPILPWPITHNLGLGLQTISPALSFGIHHSIDSIEEIAIYPSWVRVQRISYQEAETRLEQEPFCSIKHITDAFRARRQAQGAIAIELPEVEIKLVNNEIRIRLQERLRSRDLVADAMLMAGEAVARYCDKNNIAIPYVTQPAPDSLQNPKDLAGMWSYRRQMKPSRLSTAPSPHAGLGLEFYTRATSPLRRYSDLLVHQQLRAHLAGNELIDTESIAMRFDVAELGSISIRKAERLSNQHWKLAWLKRHQDWKGEAIVVDQDQERLVVIIPELALETKVRMQGGAELNERLLLKLRDVNLAELACYFATRPIKS